MYSTKVYELGKSSEALVKKWNNKYSHEISVFFQEQINVLECIANSILLFEKSSEKSTTMDNPEYLEPVLHEFHSNNLTALNTLYAKLKTKNEARDFIVKIKSALFEDIQKLPAKIIDEYNTGADFTEKGIGSNRFLRKTGNFFYYLRSVPQNVMNGFAKLIKEPVKPLKPRYHTIYYQSIVKGFLLDKYVSRIQNCTFEIQKKLIQLGRNIFELEAGLINSNYQVENEYHISGKSPEIDEQLNEIEGFYAEYEKTFLTLLEKSGTWEFPLFSILFKLKLNVNHAYKLFDSAYRLWDSTFYAFYEDWRFREELFSFVSTIRILALQTYKIYSAKLNKTLIPVITKKREYIEDLVNRIPDPDNTAPLALKHFFSSELYRLQKETSNQTIEEDLDKTSSEIKKVLQKIEVDIADALERLPDKSGVVRSPKYEKGIRKSEIYFFSPAEFIEFECLPPFLNTINSIVEEFTTNFNEIVHEFSDFDQITDFTLDTAVSLVSTQNAQEQTVLMFREGLTRSLNILDRITERSNETLGAKVKDLTGAFDLFIENVKKLDDNDSILIIYSRLIKSKAIEESKDKRRKIKGFILSSLSFLTSIINRQADTVFNFYKDIRKKLKLDKAPVSVSSEISNYLADINRRIYKLPVIYRYLFENTPVKEINLFLSRQPEIDKLNNALKDWKSGNFAATLVIGENGGGKSSLLQIYLKTIKGSYKVSYLSVSRFYHIGNDFYTLMQDIFENKGLDSDQKILEQINTAKGQRIIVIDGLERVFLRKPGGFDCLHKLLSFIVSTNNLAFWICSVSLHACNYLNKTISLKENFDYLVELNKLSSDEVKSIVLKRHRLSGFIVQYQEDIKGPAEIKKIKARQLQLETEFFNELNRFADGNISLSLYFWLESISEFTKKDLYIKQFHVPDFSFLEILTAEKVYTLLLIVLHGKITADYHALICNHSKEKSKRILTILKEDSIVVLQGDYYMLNGILYRHVVQLLKNKNLIH